jgi:hypothetical protein
MADDRTEVTEIGTALGMLGFDAVTDALATRPRELLVGNDVWDKLDGLFTDGPHRMEFEAAFLNGQAFLHAHDALRDRRPAVIEWTGGRKPPGDEVVPADLRVDHVYLVSCKYLSRIVVNASPLHLFKRLLTGGFGRRGVDWFVEVAPGEHHALYTQVRSELGTELPERAEELTTIQRRMIAKSIGRAWSDECSPLYQEIVERVSAESARLWREAFGQNPEVLLWRLLRICSAPYFVLGTAPKGFLRLRIATPWDWRRDFELRAFEVVARPGGQPMVAWRAVVRERTTRAERIVEGHVEIRWSHGRFSGPPEAKVYLDTPHTDVPGYFPLN